MNREILAILNQEADERAAVEAIATRAGGLALATAAVSPFNATNTTLVVDVSKYVPYADLAVLKAGGVRGIIVRIGQGFGNEADPMFAYYVQAAADNDLVCFGYYVIDPSWPDNTKGCIDEQLARIKKFTTNKKIQGVFIDAEIYLDSGGRVIAPTWISERTRGLIDEVQRARPDWVVGLYTGGWYVDSYGPAMKNWMHKYPLWWAYYVSIPTSVQVEWEALKDYYPLKTPGNLPPDSTGQGAAKLSLWQWSGDRLKLPGMWGDAAHKNRSAADVNFFMGNEAAFYEWAHYTPNTEPPSPPDPDDPSDDDIPVDIKVILANLESMRALINGNHAEIMAALAKEQELKLGPVTFNFTGSGTGTSN